MITERIISIDISSDRSKDYSAIISTCGSCRRVIEVTTYAPKINEMIMSIFKFCPYCGVEFKGGVIIGE